MDYEKEILDDVKIRSGLDLMPEQRTVLMPFLFVCCTTGAAAVLRQSFSILALAIR